MAVSGQLTDLSTVQTFGAAADGIDVTVPPAIAGVALQAEGQNVRITVDGSTPSATVGMILYAGDAPTVLYGQAAMQAIKAIEVAASAKLNYIFLDS